MQETLASVLASLTVFSVSSAAVAKMIDRRIIQARKISELPHLEKEGGGVTNRSYS